MPPTLLLNLVSIVASAIVNIPKSAPSVISVASAAVAGGAMAQQSGPMTTMDWLIIGCGAIGAAVNAIQIEITRRKEGVPVEDRSTQGGSN